MLSQGIPNLNKIFEDEDGIVVDHYFLGKHIIHSSLKREPDLDLLKKCRTVSDAIDVAYADRGIEKLYTWAETPEQHRYNLFLGYVPTGEKVLMPEDYPNEVLEYVKDLT